MSSLGDTSIGRESATDSNTERLPFRVTVARRDELAAVARMRAAAYGRHLPDLGARLVEPEPADFEWGCEVLVATSKLDGSILGTMRTHANVPKPLPLQASIDLPDRYAGKRLVEATRLSILGGVDSAVVRNTLFKALYLYSLQQGADWIVVTGRRPVDRIYDGLLYTDVAERGVFYPMAHVGGLPHRVMSIEVAQAESIWRRAKHPLYHFAFVAEHADIDLSEAQDLKPAWNLMKPHSPAQSHFFGGHGRAFQAPIPLRRASGAQLTA